MGMSAVAKRKMTVEDYLALPEDLRAELFGGELYMSPAPTFRHQRIIANLMEILRPFVRRHKLGEVIPSPFDCILSKVVVVQPDIVFVATAHLDRINDRLHGPPDLAIEVLSEFNAERDRIVKRDLYLEYKVPEYWIVDPETSTVEVRRLAAEAWDLVAVAGIGEVVETPQLPGLKVAVSEVFA